jgi:membrane-associated phospholipid phosphatase
MLQGRARNYSDGEYRLGVNQLCFLLRESVHAEQRVERHAPGSSDARRANLLFWTAALGGGVAEILKLLFRRERPAVHEGLYGFRPFDERTWSTAGLALPSSHAMVAFAGAAMLARLYPRARWVGYILAVGCAATRVLARAHFVSDVVLGAGLGWLVAWSVSRRWSPDALVPTLPVTTGVQGR